MRETPTPASWETPRWPTNAVEMRDAIGSIASDSVVGSAMAKMSPESE